MPQTNSANRSATCGESGDVIQIVEEIDRAIPVEVSFRIVRRKEGDIIEVVEEIDDTIIVDVGLAEAFIEGDGHDHAALEVCTSGIDPSDK